MIKKIALLGLITASVLSAKEIILKKEIQVYQVPLKYSNNLNQIQENGAIISTKVVNNSSGVWEDKNILVIFKTKNKQKQINSLLKLLKQKTKNYPDAQKLINIIKKIVEE